MRLIAFSRAPALVVALRHGLFAREGIDVSFTKTSGSREQLEALLRGEFDVAHTAADNVVARVDAGADLRIVLVAERGVEHRLVAAASVPSLARFSGHRLGVDAPESGHAVLAYVLLAEAGVTRGTYDVIPVGATRERCAALVEGRIDAAMLNAPYDERALATGCRVLADARARFPEHPALSVAVAGPWARAHRRETEAYCRALIAGERALADPRERERVIDDLAADRGVSREEAAHEYERERRAPVPTVTEMTASVAAVCAARRAAGLARGPIDVSRYFDPSYATAADPTLAGGRA